MLRLLALVAAALFAGAATPAQAQESVSVSSESSRPAVAPGDQFVIAVIFDHASGWHVHTNSPVVPKAWKDTFSPVPTVIEIEPVKGLKFGPIQWPPAREVRVDLVGSGKPQPYAVFQGRAIAYVPVIADASLPQGSMFIKVTAKYQACDAKTCTLPVVVDRPVTVRTLAKGAVNPIRVQANAKLFEGFDARVWAQTSLFSETPPGPPPPATVVQQPKAENIRPKGEKVKFDAFGFGFEVDTGAPVGLVLLVLTAVAGGLVLNLTPCVLPIIPLRLLGFAEEAENPRRCFLLGSLMSLGVIAFWLALGAAIGLGTSLKATSQLSAIPWFNLGVGVLMVVIAAGMFGAFAAALPGWVEAITPERGSLPGSFLLGVLAAVLSTPCTAPFAGAATAWASTRTPAITLLVFAAIGVGMGLPYLILSLRPSLFEDLPRKGQASGLMKQVLGLLMFAVAAWFLATGSISLVAEKPYLVKVLHWWVIAVFICLAAAWMVLRIYRISDKAPRQLMVTVLGSLVMAGPVWWAMGRTSEARLAAGEGAGSINWISYSPEAFEEARNTGKVVLLDFTAEWCLTCKVLEATVLNKPEVRSALTNEGVVAMRVDVTGQHAPGWDKLNELGEVAIPLLVVYTPGEEKPWKGNVYTVAQVVDQVDLAKARNAKGSSTAAAGTEESAGAEKQPDSSTKPAGSNDQGR